MMNKLLPITENKLRILKFIYEKKETHLHEISRELKIHPFSLQKTLRSLRCVLQERKAGRTILLSLNKNNSDYFDLLSTIEEYKLNTDNKELKLAIKNLRELFSNDKNTLTCVVFGSFARGSAKDSSDIDLLFVVKNKNKEILNKCNSLSSLMSREINPIIFNENKFKQALKTKEPATSSILEPSQRLIIIGKEYFIKNTL